jgi:hypothetical protein
VLGTDEEVSECEFEWNGVEQASAPLGTDWSVQPAAMNRFIRTEAFGRDELGARL